MLPSTLLSLLYFSPLSLATTLTLLIPPSPPLLPNPHTLSVSTHASLLSVSGASSYATTPLTRSNTLVFQNLTAGEYLLDIHCRDYVFPPLRVDIEEKKKGGEDEKEVEIGVWRTYKGHEWDNKGQKVGGGNGGEVVVEVRPLGGKEYYQQRGGFSVLSFLKSPMILMALFSMGLIFGLPYLMDNMDEETKKEFQEMQSKRGPASDPASAIQNFDIAGFLAGRSGGQAAGSSGGEAKRK
ncbi:MAG: hypothetical protein M1820_008633 [Bogoriella megaspora]|nr:MAG: hypothetical protein M1820_008633 [Bogoriella megaspora]